MILAIIILSIFYTLNILEKCWNWRKTCNKVTKLKCFLSYSAMSTSQKDWHAQLTNTVQNVNFNEVLQLNEINIKILKDDVVWMF